LGGGINLRRKKEKGSMGKKEKGSVLSQEVTEGDGKNEHQFSRFRAASGVVPTRERSGKLKTKKAKGGGRTIGGTGANRDGDERDLAKFVYPTEKRGVKS